MKLNQVCLLVEAFRSSEGSSLASEPFLDLKDFFKMLVGHARFAPMDVAASKPYSAQPPSLQLDIAARVLYPILTALKVAAFLLLIGSYESA